LTPAGTTVSGPTGCQPLLQCIRRTVAELVMPEQLNVAVLAHPGKHLEDTESIQRACAPNRSRTSRPVLQLLGSGAQVLPGR
jgi:hypothetical protein